MPRFLAIPLLLALLVPAFAEPPDPSADVKAVLQQLFDAAAKDDKAALQKIMNASQIPDAGNWIRGTFPGENGEVVARFFDLAAKSTARDNAAFSALAKKGVTIKEVRCWAAPDKAPAGSAARTLLRLMVKPVPLYSATLKVADPAQEIEFGFFVIIDGKPRFFSDRFVDDLCSPAPCKNEMKRLSAALYGFETKNKRLALTTGELEFPKEGEDKGKPECGFCREGNREYVYLYPVRGDATEMNEIVAFDPAPHPDDTRVVLFFVGRTDTMSEESFRKELLDQFARNRPTVELRLKEARAGTAAPGEDPKKKAEVLEGLLKLEDSMRNAK